MKATQIFPIFNDRGKVTGCDTSSVFIFNKGDTLIYRIPYQFDSSLSTYDGRTIVTRDVVSELRQHYVIVKTGETTGYDFDMNKVPHCRMVPMDSVYQSEWIFANDLYPILRDNYLTQSYRSDSGKVTKIYSIKGKKDPQLRASVTLEYTNQIISPFYSIMKEVDTVADMKLSRVKIVYGERYFEDFDILMDEFKTEISIENVNMEMQMYPEIINCLEKFKRS